MEHNLIDFKALSELEELMGETFVELIQMYISDSQSHLSGIESNLKLNNASQVRASAHSLKGSSSNLFVTGLVDICKNLECQANDGKLDKGYEQLEIIRATFEKVEILLTNKYLK